MKRKILFITLFLFLSFGICINSFAAGNMVNSIRNTVGGAENVVENGVRDITGAMSNMDMNNNDSNNNNNNGNDMMRTGSDNTYDATRTSTTTETGTTANTTFGMTSNMWTWVILAILAVGIIALVWSYESNNSKHE